jgi:putative transposase
VLVAIGIGTDGFRQILGVAEGEKEDLEGWRGFLRHLKDRGLDGVRLIISDACRGLIEAIAEVFPNTDWQRCMVHFYRNVFSHVPNGKVAEVARMLKAIHAQEDRKAAQGAVTDSRRHVWPTAPNEQQSCCRFLARFAHRSP